MYVNATLSIRPTLSFPHYVHRSIHYIRVSIPALQIGSSVPFFLMDAFWTDYFGDRVDVLEQSWGKKNHWEYQYVYSRQWKGIS